MVRRALALILSSCFMFASSLISSSKPNISDYPSVFHYLEANDLSHVIIEKEDGTIHYYIDLDQFDESLTPEEIHNALREEYNQNKKSIE